MKKCNKYKNLSAYINDLSDDNKEKIKKHIEHCPFCREELKKSLKLKQVLYNTPSLKVDNNISFILQKAKKQEEQNLQSLKERSPKYIKNSFIWIKNLKLEFQLASIIFIIALVFIFISFLPRYDKVYITKAHGRVIINNKDFFLNNQYKYSLKNNIHINVEEGGCVLQINKEKLIIIKQDSHINLKNNKNTILNLFKGQIVCFVKNLKNKKKLVVKTGKSEFKIIGTKFYIKNRDNNIECGVKEGKIKVNVDGKDFIIKDKEFFSIKKEGIFKEEILEDKLKEFDVLNKINFIENLFHIHGINIYGKPESSKIYQEDDILGETPFSILYGKRVKKELLIYNKGYIPQEITLKGDKHFFNLKKYGIPDLLWKYKMPSKIFTNPVKIDNYLVIAGVIMMPEVKGLIYKFDLKKHEIIWKYYIKDRINVSPIFYNNTIYFTSNDGSLFAIDYMSGKLVWKKQFTTLTYSTPYLYLDVNMDILYFSNNDRTLYFLNPGNGKTLRSIKFNKGFLSSPVISNDILYTGNIDAILHAVNMRNKKIKWKFQTKGQIIDTRPVIQGNYIFIVSRDKHIYAINRKNGQLLWKFNADSKQLSTPLIIKNTVLISAINKGILYALSIDKGQIKWKYKTEGNILIKFNLINNKYIFLGDEKNNLYLLNKYGLLYLKFKHDFYNYFTLKNTILIARKNNILYNLKLPDF